MQDGSTALGVAAAKGHFEIVRVLVKADANVNLQTKVILIIDTSRERERGGANNILCLLVLLH